MNRLTFEEMKSQQKDQSITDLLSQITGGNENDCHDGYGRGPAPCEEEEPYLD